MVHQLVTPPASRPYTVMDEVEKYLLWKASYAPRAAFCYRVWLERFYGFHKKTTQAIHYEDVTGYLNAVKEKYKVKTRQFIVTVLKDYFTWLRRTEIKDIPYELIRPPKGEADHHKPVRPEQFEEILNVVPLDTKSGRRNYAILALFWDTGLRLGELRRLEVKDLDLQTKSALIVSEKNGGKLRRIFWSERTNEALKRLKRREGYMFVNYRGELIDQRSIQAMVKIYSQRAGIPLTPHCLRTSWATNRYRKGVDLKAIQWGLGHASIKTTQIYVQPEDYEMERKLKKVLD